MHSLSLLCCDLCRVCHETIQRMFLKSWAGSTTTLTTQASTCHTHHHRCCGLTPSTPDPLGCPSCREPPLPLPMSEFLFPAACLPLEQFRFPFRRRMPSSCFRRRRTFKAYFRTSGKMSLSSSAFTVSLIRNRTLRWISFSFRILTVQLHHLTSGAAVWRDPSNSNSRFSVCGFFPRKNRRIRKPHLPPPPPPPCPEVPHWCTLA